MTETTTKRMGRERVTLQAAINSAPEVTKSTIIEVVKEQSGASTKDKLIDALAAVIAQPIARVRLFEEPELESIEEKVAEERKKQKALAGIAKLKDLGLTMEEIQAALAE